MARVIEAFTQFFDDAGDPLIDGFLKFNESGTNNTNKATYADINESIPNANPVQLDGAGRCPNVFGTGSYNVISYDSSMQQIQQFDPVGGDQSGGSLSDWNAITIYSIGDIVTGGDGKYYRSITSQNQNSSPEASPDQWEEIRFLGVWNQFHTYGAGDVVATEDGVLHRSISANNLNNVPGTSYTKWSPVADSRITIATVTPATDADVTLTEAQYSADILVIETGAWLTNRNIIVPNEQRQWRVISNSVYIATAKTDAGTGIAVAAGTSRPLVCDGVNVVDPLTDKDLPGIFSVGATVAANALTATLSPCTADFRSSTLNNGAASRVRIPSTISITVSSGSTLGTVANIKARLALLAINDVGAGVRRLGVVNLAGGNNLDETTLITTTAEGGAGGADSANVIYTDVAVTTPSPFRVVGYVDITEATPGTWATGPTTVQGAGGNAMTSLQSFGYGKPLDVTGSRAYGATYYNDTGTPRKVTVRGRTSIANGTLTAYIDGVAIAAISQTTASTVVWVSISVYPGGSYSVDWNGGTTVLSSWTEQR
jgi:hypothetical protein